MHDQRLEMGWSFHTRWQRYRSPPYRGPLPRGPGRSGGAAGVIGKRQASWFDLVLAFQDVVGQVVERVRLGMSGGNIRDLCIVSLGGRQVRRRLKWFSLICCMDNVDVSLP